MLQCLRLTYERKLNGIILSYAFGFGDKTTTLWLAVLMLLRQGFSRLLADRVKKMNEKSLIVSYEAPPRSNFDRRVERSEFWWFCCFVSALSLFTQVYKRVLATY